MNGVYQRPASAIAFNRVSGSPSPLAVAHAATRISTSASHSPWRVLTSCLAVPARSYKISSTWPNSLLKAQEFKVEKKMTATMASAIGEAKNSTPRWAIEPNGDERNARASLAVRRLGSLEHVLQLCV